VPGHDFEHDVRVLFSGALERERAGVGSDAALLVVRDRLALHLGRWIGDDGWAALFARATREVAEHPSPDSPPDTATLLAVAAILLRLIGADLALRLLTQACEPTAVPPTREIDG